MIVTSRKYVNIEYIETFPPSERFIKLPINSYIKLLGIDETLNRPQIGLINAINDPRHRFVCAAFARRLGKTFIANVIGQLISLIPNSNVLIISPNYNLSSISFDLQRKFINHFDLETSRDNLKDKIIELSNGSTIRMGSITTVDSCVGRSYDLIIFDEAALSSGGEEAFNVALRPTLDKSTAKAIFISTPRGKQNWFSKFFMRGFDDEYPEWCSLQADYTENVRMNASDVAEARKSMSRAEFEQEYNASFTEFVGQIFTFSASNVLDYEPGDDEIIAGCDPGYKDPTAFVVIAYNPSTDCYWVVDEYQESGNTTATHAAAFNSLIKKWEVENIFIDSAAAQFAGDLAYMYDIPTIKANKSKLSGIAFVQTLVEQDRLKVAPHCLHTIACLDQYRWDAKRVETPVHDDYSHMADALRYALYSFTT